MRCGLSRFSGHHGEAHVPAGSEDPGQDPAVSVGKPLSRRLTRNGKDLVNLTGCPVFQQVPPLNLQRVG